MSFAAAEQWFEAWQLRLLVLASLFFQYFLFATAIVRKLRVPPWFRALIWLAYQAGDVVAVYALATLFNEHKERVAAHHLDTLWAPVLLLHLGGQDGITAYSIEDNENWRRYLLLAVCQITVAVYVFRKSWWSGDLLLLRAAILLFVPGFLKCLEKPWALKNATATSIINSSDSRMKATLDLDNELQKEIFSQEEYVMAAAECVAEFQPKQLELFVDEVADQPHHLFVDLGHPYSIRLCNLRLVAPKAARADVHSLLRSSLSKAFDRLYTKHKASFGGLLRAAVVLLTFVDIGLFQKSHRRGLYERADVVVTYVLLCCTAALEFVSACVVLSSGLPRPDDQLAQYNLVDYLARGEKRPWFWTLVRRLGARLQLDRLWCTAPPEPSLGITRLVYDHLATGWKEIRESLYKYDATTRECKPADPADGVRAYRRFNDSRGQRTIEREWWFNDSRGQRTLERECCVSRSDIKESLRMPFDDSRRQGTLERECCVGRSAIKGSAIKESLRMPFDDSVLLWHLATEFCYFDHVDTGNDATRHSRMVSNYMAYLLFVEPEMLIPGARSKLFRATYLELRKMLRPPPEEDDEAIEVEPTEKKAPPPRAKNEMVRKVIQKVKSSTIVSLASEDLVHKAWAVAHELMEFAELKKQEFISELKYRDKKREDVISVLRCAKMKADEFIGIKNKKREEVLNKLMEVMRPAQNKANEFINDKSKKAEFMKVIKEAKEKAEWFIKEDRTKKGQTEEERITNLVQCAKYKAGELIKNEEEKKEPKVCCTPTNTPTTTDKEEAKETKKAATVEEFSKNAGEIIKETTFLAQQETKKQTKEEGLTKLLQCVKYKAEEIIKNEEEKKELEGCCTPTDTEQEKEKKVKEFSENAGEIIKVATDLVEMEKEKLKESKEEAKDKAVEFINEAAKFISEEKTKNQTKEEEKIRDLLESAGKKAEELVAAAQASWKEEEKEVLEFSKHAGFAIQQEAEENQRRKELKEWHLIVDEDELRMIRSREYADDKMWAVIQGVWVEMLCFSAGRCRGYLHAKSLGNGGEYLSYVWLLLYYMGMETMPERVQRPELPTLGDTGALVKTPSDEDMDDDEEEPAQGRTATSLRWRRRAVHDAPSATPPPQAAGATTSGAQTAPTQQAQQQQQREVHVHDLETGHARG